MFLNVNFALIFLFDNKEEYRLTEAIRWRELCDTC